MHERPDAPDPMLPPGALGKPTAREPFAPEPLASAVERQGGTHDGDAYGPDPAEAYGPLPDPGEGGPTPPQSPEPTIPGDLAALPTQPLVLPSLPALPARPSPAELARAAYPPGTLLPSVVAARRAHKEQAQATRRTRLLSWTVAIVALFLLLAPAGPSKDALYAGAAAARAAWRYDRALAFYQRAASSDSSDPQPQCLMAQIFALQQLYARSIAAYGRCAALGGNGPAVWLAMGDVARASGDAEAAARDWLRSVALGGVTARRRLGELYETQGRFDLAQAQWSSLAASQHHTPSPAVGEAEEHLGLLALRTGDYDAARTHLIAAREQPGVYGQDAVDQGFVQLAALAPQDAAGLTRVGIAFVQAGLTTFATMPLEQAIALDPRLSEAHAYLAWLDWLAGRLAASRSETSTALQLAPGNPFALFVAAEQALAAGHWSDAESDLTLAIAHDDKNPILWAERGRASDGLHDYVRAELNYETAANLASEPEFTLVYLTFYVERHYGLDAQRALRAAALASQRWPKQAQVQELVGQIYDLVGQTTTAMLTYQRANQLDPSDPQPYFELGRLALAGGEYDSAVLDLRTAIALRPAGPLAAKARALLAPIATIDI